MARYFVIEETFVKPVDATAARLVKVGEEVEVSDDLRPGVSLIPIDAAAVRAKAAVAEQRETQRIDTSSRERRLRTALGPDAAARLASLEAAARSSARSAT
jgi:hypothetical protein